MSCDGDPDVCEGPAVPAGEAALLAKGWTRCFAAEGARLEEAVSTYEEIGFDVTTLPVEVPPGACAGCIPPDGSLRMIYTRKPAGR